MLMKERLDMPVAVWPDLAKFRHFGKKINFFGHFLSNYLVFGKIVNLLWQIFDTFGQNFLVRNGHTLKQKCSHLVTLVVVGCGALVCAFDTILSRWLLSRESKSLVRSFVVKKSRQLDERKSCVFWCAIFCAVSCVFGATCGQWNRLKVTPAVS